MTGGAGRLLCGFGAAILLIAAATTAPAQGFSPRTGVPLAMGQDVSVPRAPLLTIDRERLFTESEYGRQVQALLLEASRTLAAENRRIEGELASRERELTDLRDTLPFEEFRALADAFDERVTQARREQDAKTRVLQRRRELARQQFFVEALPVLSQIVREAGAVAILDRSVVFLTSEQVDVTDVAIVRLDQSLGDPVALPSVETPLDPEDDASDN